MDARHMLLDLLAARAPEATVCPSEVARAWAAAEGVSTGAAWRDAMPAVHAAVDGLVSEGRISLSWKGNRLERRTGPYRIGRSASGGKT